MKKIGLYLMALFYVIAGFNHFRNPDFYMPMMPPFLPVPFTLIILSGVAEMGLGILLLWKKTQRKAAWGIIILLIAIFPANVYMLTTNGAGFDVPYWVLVARLPFQLVFIAWAYLYTRSEV